jgi:hypothetical protein
MRRLFPIALMLIAAGTTTLSAQQVAVTDGGRPYARCTSTTPRCPSGAVQPPRAEVVSDTVVYGTVDGKQLHRLPLAAQRVRRRMPRASWSSTSGGASTTTSAPPPGVWRVRICRHRGGPVRRQGGYDTRQRHRADARRER